MYQECTRKNLHIDMGPANRMKYVFLIKRFIFIWIRAYVRRVEPEGGKPIILYHNPGLIYF